MTTTTNSALDIHTDSARPLRLAVILASVREGRFGPVVAGWIQQQATEHGDYDVDLIDLAQEHLPLNMPDASPLHLGHDYPRPTEMAALTQRLDAADAFVIVTPEYNHSYPAALKVAIDWHFMQWQAKPIGYVTYGGLAGGARAVMHLRDVFAELHAVSIRDSVSFPMFWEKFDGDGQPLDPETAGAAKVMLDQLGWWGSALRTARAESPYAA